MLEHDRKEQRSLFRESRWVPRHWTEWLMMFAALACWSIVFSVLAVVGIVVYAVMR